MPVILPVRPPSPFSTVSCLVHFWLGKLLIAQPALATLCPSLSRSPPGKLPTNPLKGALIFFCCCPKKPPVCSISFQNWQRQHASSVCGNHPLFPLPHFCHSWRLQCYQPTLSLSFPLLNTMNAFAFDAIWRGMRGKASSTLPLFPFPSPPHTYYFSLLSGARIFIHSFSHFTFTRFAAICVKM